MCTYKTQGLNGTDGINGFNGTAGMSLPIEVVVVTVIAPLCIHPYAAGWSSFATGF